MMRVLLTATPGRDVFAEPSTVLLSTGEHRSLCEVTLARLETVGFGPVTICSVGASADLERVAARHQVEYATGSTIGAVCTSVLAEHADLETVVLVDARAAFVSPTVIRGQLELHATSGAELTLAPFAARGLAAVVVGRASLERLATAHQRQLQLDFVTDFYEFIDQSRAHYKVADLTPDPRFTCFSVNLVPTVRSRAEALIPYLLADTSEDYDRVFDEFGAASWNRWTSRPARVVPSRPKIVFVNYNGNPYGATRLLEQWLELWDSTRFEIVVTQPSQNELIEKTRERHTTHYLQARWPNAQYAPYPDRSWSDALAASLEILDLEKPDLVWLHGFVPAMAVAARIRGVASITYAQTPIFGGSPSLGSSVLRNAALEACDLVVACATSYEAALRRAFRPPAGRLTSSPVGLDTTMFDPTKFDRVAQRRRFGFPEAGPIVLSASAMIPFKRPDVSIRAFHALLPRMPDATLVLAGAEVGPVKGYLHSLELLAEELGIAERVKFLGFVEDMPAMFAAADVLVHTSISEPFGLVIVEAMAMGLPAVCMDAYGPGEHVIHGETGYKVPPADGPEQIAAALFDVLSNPEQAAAFGRAGRERACALYDLGHQVRTLEDTCRAVIAGA